MRSCDRSGKTLLLCCLLKVFELLFTHSEVARLVVLNENLDVGLCVNHLGAIVHRLGLIDLVLAHFTHYVSKLLQIVLHEVDLTNVVLLHPIEAIPVLIFDLVDALIDHIDMPTVLVACLARS